MFTRIAWLQAGHVSAKDRRLPLRTNTHETALTSEKTVGEPRREIATR